MNMRHVFALAVCFAAACGGSEQPAEVPSSEPSAAASDMPKPAESSATDMPKPTETSKPEDKPPATPDILDTAKKEGLNAFVEAVNAAGLADTLKGPGPFTVFAPSDEAFKKLPKAQVDKLMKDKDGLAKILKYHVVASKLMAADVLKAKDADTVEGTKVKIAVKGADVTVGKGKITKSDIAAGNGVIHIIDAVNMPAK